MQRKVTSFMLALFALGLTACAATSSPEPQPLPEDPTPDQASQAEMPAYCRDEAAAQFKQRPQDIITLPAEQIEDRFTVYGQFPLEGADQTFFTCTFSDDGKLIGVEQN